MGQGSSCSALFFLKPYTSKIIMKPKLMQNRKTASKISICGATTAQNYSRAMLLVPWLIVQPSYLFKISLDRLNSRVVKLLGYWFNCSNPSLLFKFWPE